MKITSCKQIIAPNKLKQQKERMKTKKYIGLVSHHCNFICMQVKLRWHNYTWVRKGRLFVYSSIRRSQSPLHTI